MGLEALSWYCEPRVYGLWGEIVDSSLGSYTPCAIDSIVVSGSHLVLLCLCLYRVWLIKKDPRAKRFRLSSNYYNYMLALLASFSAAEPFLRWMTGVSIFNLDGQTGFAPFEVGLQLIALKMSSFI